MNFVFYQVILLKNETKEVRLDALCLKDGKAETICNGITNVLDEYDLWAAIKMLISDTTAVNTGAKNGVIVRLQRLFTMKGFDAPQFISCQQHVLDRILRLVMDEEIGENHKSPNIEYPFISHLISNYKELKEQFVNGIELITDKSGWRDDMKFLYHLTRVFRFYIENDRTFSCVNFKKIPNISNARWNSRAILAILAFILMPDLRSSLEKVCRFISFDWADYWFSDQMYRITDYGKLSEILNSYKKALNCLKNHWKREPSMLSIPRSNQCAERAIKIMQDLYGICQKKDKLPLRFILSNKK